MIQAGVVFSIVKKLPRHLLPETLVTAKSAELMVQVLPPNDTETLTLVLQGYV